MTEDSTSPDSGGNFGAILRHRATESPAKPAYTFLHNGLKEAESVSYQELYESAGALAARLGELPRSARALLLYPHRLEFIRAFWACLLAGVVPVPCYPPRNSRSAERLLAIARDAQASVVLTDETVRSRPGGLLAEIAPCLVTDEVAGGGAADAFGPAIVRPTDPALLQYTSGSTGTPKGVVVSHENLHCNQELIRAAFGQDSTSTIVSWLPFYHDMGLIGNVLHAVYIGAPAVFIPPVEFLRRPLTWLEAISRYRATGSGGPNFGFQLCADRITGEQAAQLDLSHWSVAYCGAELVRAPTLTSFAERFEVAGFRAGAFRPCYGMAEATLLVAAADGLVTRAPDSRAAGEADGGRAAASLGPAGEPAVSCGVPRRFRCLIVDMDGAVCPEGEVGEVWLSGASIAGGYWNNPGASEAFRAFTRSGQGPFYRTGDLGFLLGGELQVTGRIKELIIIRGRNHYPYDLEWSIAENVRGAARDGCVVFSVDREQGEELIVQCEYDGSSDRPHADVIQAIRAVLLEDFGIAPAEVLLFAARRLPRTSSGKLQRTLCKSAFLAGEFGGLAHWRAGSGEPAGGTSGDRAPFPAASDAERLIVRAVERLKGTVLTGRDDTFFSAGFDSLALAELAAVLSAEVGQAVSVDLLFQHPTIPELGAKLDALPLASAPPAEPAEPASAAFLPLSSIQESIWIDHQSRAPDNRYNIPIRVDFPPDVSRERIEESFAQQLSRAELLSCQILWRDGCLGRVPLAEEAHRLPVLDLSDAGPEQAAELNACARTLVLEPFNLDEPPLFRAVLARLPGGSHTLVFVAHHIVCDGFSLTAFAQRLLAACEPARDGSDRPAAQPDASYRIYVRRQRELLARDGRDAGEYWRRQLADAAPLRLPRDRWLARDGARGPIASQWMHLSDEQSRSLTGLARRCRTTPFAVALAAFATVIGKITRRPDVVIGVPLLDRDLPAMRDTFGPCVNPVTLRCHLSRDQSGTDRVSAVGSWLTEALRHRVLPLREVAAELTASQGDRRAPLTSVSFNGLTFAPRDQVIAGFLGDQGLTARLDLDVYAIFDGGGGGSLRWDYDSSLFEAQTVRWWMAAFAACLRRLGEPADEPLDAEPLLAPPARPPRPAGRAEHADAPRPLVAMIRDTMERIPERVAVVTPHTETTFGALLESSRRACGYLRGNPAEGPVGLYFQPRDTAAAISAMIGALDAGRRYVVLEPRDPALRLRRIVAAAGVRVVLANGAVPWIEEDGADEPGRQRPRVVQMDETGAAGPRGNPAGEPRPGYLLYTSGTSGAPKGVIQDADNVRYFVEQYRCRLSITEQDTLSLVSSLGFDAAVLDVYTALVTGAQLRVLALHDDDTFRDLWQWVADQSVTVFHSTPSLYRKLMSTRSGGNGGRLRAVVLGGEPVLPADGIRHFELFSDVELYNLYGQAESTFNALRRFEKEHAARTVTLGVPCDGTSFAVRTERGGSPEVYEVGEIVVESPHVAKGYLGQPQLSASKFQGVGYRTGDSGRFLPSGEIEFVGREDRQLKVNGYRVEPAETESTLMSYPGVTRAQVLKHQEGEGGEFLAAYVEVPDERQRRTLDPADIRGFLTRNLPGYMVPSVTRVLDAFPLTPNNKLDTARLPSPGERAADDRQPTRPMNARERAVADCMEGVLAVAVSSPAASFFELGGNSISVIELLHRLEKTTGLTLSFKDVFEAPTVAAIAARLASAPSSARPALSRNLSRAEYPLTSSQTRIWIQSQRTSYNVLASIDVGGGLEPRRLERAIDAVVARHEILRTRFVVRGGEVVQRVVPAAAACEVLIEQVDPSGDQELQLAELERRELHRRFDLAGGPLFQVTYVTGALPHDVLMLSMQHIACDAISVAIFTEEVLRAYALRRDSLPKPALQYGDYALWLRDLGERGFLAPGRTYWEEKLKDGVPALKLRTDRPRGPVKSFTGAVYHGAIDETLATRTRDQCLAEGVTLFNFLHAVLVLTLFNRTGQTDLCLGTLSTGREFSRHLESQIGFLANTLALRTAFSRSTPFRELLATARKEFLESQAHQLFPLEQLADVVPHQEPGRGFLFDVLMVLHGWGDLGERVRRETGMEIALRDRRECVSKFDLTLNFADRGGRIDVMIEFDPQLYDEGSVALLWRRFTGLLAEVLDAPDRPLGEYSGKVEEEERVAAAGPEIEFDF